jgi:hypothetical protein
MTGGGTGVWGACCEGSDTIPRPVVQIDLGQPSPRDVQHRHILRRSHRRTERSVRRARRVADAQAGAPRTGSGGSPRGSSGGAVGGCGRALVGCAQAQLGVPHAPLRHVEARRVQEVRLAHREGDARSLRDPESKRGSDERKMSVG